MVAALSKSLTTNQAGAGAPALATDATFEVQAAQLFELLGAPALTQYEDEESYMALLRQFWDLIEPVDFLERIRVKDLTDLTVEVARCARAKKVTISFGRIGAVKDLLDQKPMEDFADLGGVFGEYEGSPLSIVALTNSVAKGSKEPAYFAQFRVLLAKFGLELDDLDDLSYANDLDTIETITRLATAAALRRDKIIDDLEQRRRAKASKRSSDDVVDAEFS